MILTQSFDSSESLFIGKWHIESGLPGPDPLNKLQGIIWLYGGIDHFKIGHVTYLIGQCRRRVKFSAGILFIGSGPDRSFFSE